MSQVNASSDESLSIFTVLPGSLTMTTSCAGGGLGNTCWLSTSWLDAIPLASHSLSGVSSVLMSQTASSDESLSIFAMVPMTASCAGGGLGNTCWLSTSWLDAISFASHSLSSLSSNLMSIIASWAGRNFSLAAILAVAVCGTTSIVITVSFDVMPLKANCNQDIRSISDSLEMQIFVIISENASTTVPTTAKQSCKRIQVYMSCTSKLYQTARAPVEGAREPWNLKIFFRSFC